MCCRVSTRPHSSALRNLYDSPSAARAFSGLPLMQLAVALKAGGDQERALWWPHVEALGDNWERTVRLVE